MASSKKQMAIVIVIFSITLVVIYDLRLIWKNRPIACDIHSPNCPSEKVCSKPATDQSARCLPLATPATTFFSLPFEANTRVHCPAGNRDGELHITDFNLFSVTFKAPSKFSVLAAAAGKLVLRDQEARIIHQDGYISTYFPLKEFRAGEGEVSAGEVLGISDGPLEFGVHYLNPQADEALVKDSPSAGFSVPFRMQIKFSKDRRAPVHRLLSTDIPCGASASALFR